VTHTLRPFDRQALGIAARENQRIAEKTRTGVPPERVRALLIHHPYTDDLLPSPITTNCDGF
jgi:hypothetical protein